MMKTMNKKKLNLIILSLFFVLIVALGIYLAFYFYYSSRSEDTDRVIGIDVSAYQGEIDWKKIEDQGIAFAYIKATEGEDYLDEEFENNWENITSTNIRRGAYLFFNFDDDAKKTAEYFIEVVPKDKSSLPPVIDIELTGNEEKKPDKNKVVDNVQILVDKLRAHYGQDPIIYTNMNTFNEYFTDKFEDIPFWIASVNGEDPELKNHKWIFWQYTWRNVLNGVESTFVDGDLYNGDYEQFRKTFKKGWF